MTEKAPIPTPPPPATGEHAIGFWDICILILSVFVLVGVVAQTALDLDEETSRLLFKFDFAVCMVFLADFTWRFIRAENKWRFMRWGWIDLLASIPMLDHLRWGRLVRVWRIAVLFRGIRSFRNLADIFIRHRARTSLLAVAMFAVLLAMISALLVLHFEAGHPDSTIETAEEALWWTMATMSTVGYGDYVPVTTLGRVVGGVLMFVGVGVFGVISGTLAAWFVVGPRGNENILADLAGKLDRIEKQLSPDRRKD